MGEKQGKAAPAIRALEPEDAADLACLQAKPGYRAGTLRYERHGFEREGILRDWAFRGGRYVDAVAMARLRPDRRSRDSC